MARRCKLEPRPSARTVKLADGSVKTATGTVTATCALWQAEGHGTPLEFEAEFCVTELQGYDVIIGMPWLSHFNPAIDWSSGRLVVQRPGQGPAVLGRCSPKEPDERIEPEVAAVQQFSCSAISYAQMARSIRKGDIDFNSIELMRVRISEPEDATRAQRRTAGDSIASVDDTQPQDPQLRALLRKYAHLLPAELPSGLPPERSIVHRIELTNDAKPHAPPLRRYSPLEDEEIRKQVTKLVERGHARESTSPWGAMVLLAKKKDGSLRFCVDYRILNNQTLKNRYALPLADDCFDRAQGAHFFTKLDLHSGFWQIRLSEDSAPMTAFRTRFGHYEFTVLPMGLCNAPATFMHLMNSVLRKQLDRFVLAFLDDIFIYSKTREEHLEHIEEVLKELDSQKLYLKPSKCEWMKPEVEFLGHRIGREGLSVDPLKIDAVKQWPTPTNVPELRSFLGLAGYYRRFINNYSATALPLTELTKDDVEWKWADEQHGAFEALKLQLGSAPVLLLANPELPYVIHCDASGFAVGACLMQDQWQRPAARVVPVQQDEAGRDSLCSPRAGAAGAGVRVQQVAPLLAQRQAVHRVVGPPVAALLHHSAGSVSPPGALEGQAGRVRLHHPLHRGTEERSRRRAVTPLGPPDQGERCNTAGDHSHTGRVPGCRPGVRPGTGSRRRCC